MVQHFVLQDEERAFTELKQNLLLASEEREYERWLDDVDSQYTDGSITTVKYTELIRMYVAITGDSFTLHPIPSVAIPPRAAWCDDGETSIKLSRK